MHENLAPNNYKPPAFISENAEEYNIYWKRRDIVPPETMYEEPIKTLQDPWWIQADQPSISSGGSTYQQHVLTPPMDGSELDLDLPFIEFTQETTHLPVYGISPSETDFSVPFDGVAPENSPPTLQLPDVMCGVGTAPQNPFDIGNYLSLDGFGASQYHANTPPLPESDHNIMHLEEEEETKNQQKDKSTSSSPVFLVMTYPNTGAARKYRIRCNIDDINTNELTTTFRQENCIYPKATLPPQQYKGKRQNFEKMYNELGWRLASLNPQIRGKKGLIQYAVDNYRNRTGDMSMWSRRARRSVCKNKKSHR